MLGGAGGNKEDMNRGNKLSQVVEISPFSVHDDKTPNTLSYVLKYERILPKGIVDRSDRLFITGGVDSLNPDGTIISVIEIDNL